VDYEGVDRNRFLIVKIGLSYTKGERGSPLQNTPSLKKKGPIDKIYRPFDIVID